MKQIYYITSVDQRDNAWTGGICLLASVMFTSIPQVMILYSRAQNEVIG